jgi:putative membrane protein
VLELDYLYTLPKPVQASAALRLFRVKHFVRLLGTMLDLVIHWFLSAGSLLITAYLFPGIQVKGLGTALLAPIVIGFINATIGLIIKILTLPLTIVTLGIFWLVINALMLQLAAAIVPGFYVGGFISAFFGAIILSLINMLLRSLVE